MNSILIIVIVGACLWLAIEKILTREDYLDGFKMDDDDGVE